MGKVLLSLLLVIFTLLVLRISLGYCAVLQCSLLSGPLSRTIPRVEQVLNPYNVSVLPLFARNLYTIGKNQRTENGVYTYVSWGILRSVDYNLGQIYLTDAYGKEFSVMAPELLEIPRNPSLVKTYYLDGARSLVEGSLIDLQSAAQNGVTMVYWTSSQPLVKLLLDRLQSDSQDYVLPGGSISQIFIYSTQ